VLDAPGYPEPEYGDTSFNNSNDTDDFGVSEFGGGFGGSGGCNAGIMTFVMLSMTAAAYGILRGKNR
jgi:hypothetical protein